MTPSFDSDSDFDKIKALELPFEGQSPAPFETTKDTLTSRRQQRQQQKAVTSMHIEYMTASFDSDFDSD
jgi:hypothetical protein